MCLRVEEEEIYIATKNIRCYKTMYLIDRDTTKFKSEFRSFVYEKGGHYYQTKFRKSTPTVGHSLTRNGFHSYRNIGQVSFCVTSRYADDDHYTKAILCVIPKGSKYILGRNSEYFSSYIVIKGLITPKKYEGIVNGKGKTKKGASQLY